ncbi:MAG: 16S rRNA (guanine(966)-N(2))-methyltransferase RsmD [Gammaproteobacteria bacterium]|nr:16S rRNA (guanine(966)-N(2))-methyltransferase RsmD [Gammaproteobacteria bacterium]
MKKTSKQTPESSLRIIAGEMRGRKISFASAEGLRPTLDRIRETLFNWLAYDIHGSECLDLFAGSGALGFEAISRGAASVVMVDNNAQVCQKLKANQTLLKIENMEVINQSYAEYLNQNDKKFDLIFLDPPFHQNLLPVVFQSLHQHIKPNGLVYVEQEKQTALFEPDDKWLKIKNKQAGSFVYGLYQLKND